MNVYDDFKTIEQHIVRARQQRSAALGALIGTALAGLWHGVVQGYALLTRKMVETAKTHVAPGEPSTIVH